MEEFRDIKEYKGSYQISNLGRVKSLARLSLNGRNLREKILKHGVNSHGYCSVILCDKLGVQKSHRVHKLVAIEFLGHTPCGFDLVVNHKNFNKTDNRLENLEIVTTRENANRKHLKSSSKYVGVSWNKKSQKWRADIVINGRLKYLGIFENELDASNAYQKELQLITNK